MAGAITLTLRADGAELVSRGGRITATSARLQAGTRTARSAASRKVNYLVGDAALLADRTSPPTAACGIAGGTPESTWSTTAAKGSLEYDFVVASGRQSAQDRDALRRGRTDAAGCARGPGDRIPAGELRQARPMIYQEIGGERHPVAGGYVLRGRTVRFEIGGVRSQASAGDRPHPDLGGVFRRQPDRPGSRHHFGCRGQRLRYRVDSLFARRPGCLHHQIEPHRHDRAAHDPGRRHAGRRCRPRDRGGFGRQRILAGGTNADDFPIVAVSSALSGAGYDGFIAKMEPTLKTYVYSGYMGGE